MTSDTRILCEISSDLSAADEKKFVEKNKNFWSMKKHYLRIEYTVRVLIGPADIRFELWFDNQKLSRDQSIRVEWTPTQAPVMEAGSPAPVDMSNHEPIELPTRRPTRMDAQPLAGTDRAVKAKKSFSTSNGLDGSPDRADKLKRGMGGLFAKARGGKWTVTR
jgi:hypothetical protein